MTKTQASSGERGRKAERSLLGPTLPSAASAGQGSYLGISCPQPRQRLDSHGNAFLAAQRNAFGERGWARRAKSAPLPTLVIAIERNAL
jgi:hypothetical protein